MGSVKGWVVRVWVKRVCIERVCVTIDAPQH